MEKAFDMMGEHANADVDETYDYACHTIVWKIENHFGVK